MPQDAFYMAPILGYLSTCLCVYLFLATKDWPGVIMEMRGGILYFLGTERRFYFLNQVGTSRQTCFLDNAQLRTLLLKGRKLA